MNYNLVSPQTSKYRITRRGRKLQSSDDSKTLVALPRDVPERTWAEILQKEENDLIVFDIREEILEEALRIGYEHYMDRQNAPFTVLCAAEAWLKLIDWHFYRHDPGEESSAHPPCYIPKRVESWIPDEIPEPSPKDSWCKNELDVVENTTEEGLKHYPSTSSLDFPITEKIPQEYWFPGKVRLQGEFASRYGDKDNLSDSYGKIGSSELAADSELLQKVTDYTTEEISKKESQYSALKTTTPVEGSLRGAGDSKIVIRKKKTHEKSKIFTSKPSVAGRSRGTILPPLESHSRVSIISDCRLRNLRYVPIVVIQTGRTMGVNPGCKVDWPRCPGATRRRSHLVH